MLGVIWSGASNASDILLLAAAIVAGLYALVQVVAADPIDALPGVAVALIALGLLAI